jgi:N-acetylglutamate synthase-like GNAT family acetyltransferase
MFANCSRAFLSVSFRKIAWGSLEYQKTLEIRDLVLRRPHGQSIADDDLRFERDVHLYAAFSDLKVIGTAYLSHKSANTIQLRQLAIHPRFQRSGVGSAFVRFLEDEARKSDANRIYLEARVVARRFYENLRYEAVSKEFSYRTIPHLAMEKSLKSLN